jgi:hypothetical protein
MENINENLSNVYNYGCFSNNFFSTFKTFDTISLMIDKAKIRAYPEEFKHQGLTIKIKDHCFLEISSKILGSDYANLLSIKTFPDVCKKLENIGFLIDPDDLLDSTVTRIDLTRDLKMNYPIKKYLSSLKLLYLPDKYNLNSYRNESVTIKSQAKTHNNYLSFYDKFREILKNPIDGIDPNLFKNVLRIEHRFNKTRKIKEVFKISNSSLKTVLSVSFDPTIDFLSKLKPCTDLFYSEKDSFKNEVEKKGLKSLLEEFNYDIEKLQKYIDFKNSNPLYWRKKISQIIKEERVNELSLLDEIIEKMKCNNSLEDL